MYLVLVAVSAYCVHYSRRGVLSVASGLGVLNAHSSALPKASVASYAAKSADSSSLVHVTPDTRTIRYYGAIESDSLLQLNCILTNWAIEATLPIHLHVQSNGGELVPALYTSDLISTLKQQACIHTHVNGMAASAATLLTVPGSYRTMTNHSLMMIHELSTGHSGRYHELEGALQTDMLMMDHLVDVYVTNTGLAKNSLKEMLHYDAYMNVTRCLAYGFVDAVE